ncbi:inhibin alpha chain-like [Scleropages formosus]|uniref:Inhibin alpha chain n=2 Tax=Scleropages formosus TaxID=113540 RepID=A0A0P7TZV0_SCLFO|nr:inhibin alpha chain [Scleropages formosus]KPP67179.1 inhibin alpha chain-like [Scleropages formosus]
MSERHLRLLIFALVPLVLWVPTRALACEEAGLPRNVVVEWFKQRVLDVLGLKEPPVSGVVGPPQPLMSRVGRAAWAEKRRSHEETSQVILFPSSDSTCAHTLGFPVREGSSHFTYYFQLSTHGQETVVTSAHFWFYAGEGAVSSNASAPLYILTTQQQLIHVAEEPESRIADGWTTYHVGRRLYPSIAEGPFMVQVRCPTCSCQADADKTPFLHLHTRSRGLERSRRAPIPWSPSAIDLLQRPSRDKHDFGDCRRTELNISFEDLGWDNWIVHPKVLTFSYCHGNCTSRDRVTTVLGLRQCCAPVPETMKSLHFHTTSDGGYSFKYETLPNIVAEDCSCV